MQDIPDFPTVSKERVNDIAWKLSPALWIVLMPVCCDYLLVQNIYSIMSSSTVVVKYLHMGNILLLY